MLLSVVSVLVVAQSISEIPEGLMNNSIYCCHFKRKLSITCTLNWWRYNITVIQSCGPGSSVSIATAYRLDSPGIESQWGRDFPYLSRPALGPTQPPVQWVPGLSWGKERPGVTLNPHPLLVPWSWKGRAIPLLPIWSIRPVQSLSACARVTFTFTFCTVWQTCTWQITVMSVLSSNAADL